jgi:hypothetical protein
VTREYAPFAQSPQPGSGLPNWASGRAHRQIVDYASVLVKDDRDVGRPRRAARLGDPESRVAKWALPRNQRARPTRRYLRFRAFPGARHTGMEHSGFVHLMDCEMTGRGRWTLAFGLSGATNALLVVFLVTVVMPLRTGLWRDVVGVPDAPGPPDAAGGMLEIAGRRRWSPRRWSSTRKPSEVPAIARPVLRPNHPRVTPRVRYKPGRAEVDGGGTRHAP